MSDTALAASCLVKMFKIIPTNTKTIVTSIVSKAFAFRPWIIKEIIQPRIIENSKTAKVIIRDISNDPINIDTLNDLTM